MSFPRYESYKDSGVEWLNTIPSHWIDLPLKAVASHNNDVLDERTADDYEIFYVDISSVNPINGITSKEAMPFSAAPSRARRRVKHGDVIVSTVRTYLRAIARINEPEENLVVSTGFCVVRPSGRVFHGFLGYLLSSSYFVDAVISHSDGVSYPAINASALVGIKVPLPPIPEQQTIAAFLDRETAKINALIAEQQRLIELLKEKRQSVISHAVTKGLNPHVPMKDSGIEWLGEVPEHWNKMVAKRVTNVFVPQRNKPELNDEGDGVFWATMEDMKKDEINQTGFWVSEKAAKDAGSRILSKGAVIASCVGNFGVASINVVDVIINQQLQAYIPKPVLKVEYLRYFIDVAKVYFERVGTAATLIYVNQQGFENLPLVLPPLLEQENIVSYLSFEASKSEKLINEAKFVITLLQERRTALISAAVTGKIDVRGLVSTKTEVKAGSVPC